MDESEILKAFGSLQQTLERHRTQDRKILDAKHTENKAVLEAQTEEMRVMKDQISVLTEGFPDGDPRGHREYHELLRNRERQKAKIRDEVITHLAKHSTWMAIVGVCGVFWFYFKTHIKNWMGL